MLKSSVFQSPECSISSRSHHNRLYCVNMHVPTALTTGVLIMNFAGWAFTTQVGSSYSQSSAASSLPSGGFVALASVASTSLMPDRSRLGTDLRRHSRLGQRFGVGVALFFLGSKSLLLHQLVCSFSSHG